MSGSYRKVLLGLRLSSVGLAVTTAAAVLFASVQLRNATRPFIRFNYVAVELMTQNIQLV